jgi:putative holliday junction resolvase
VSRILGVDYGSVRVGIAVSDPLGLTAQPLEVVATRESLLRITRLADQYDVDEIVVGLPTGLSGREGPAAVAARRFAGQVEDSTGRRVVMVDERFTTHTAQQAFRQAGGRGRDMRGVVDKVAAAVILQHYLDGRR